MTTHITGVYRTAGVQRRPNDVRVFTEGRDFDITEAEYRQREWMPSFEDLPWQSTGSADGNEGDEHAQHT